MLSWKLRILTPSTRSEAPPSRGVVNGRNGRILLGGRSQPGRQERLSLSLSSSPSPSQKSLMGGDREAVLCPGEKTTTATFRKGGATRPGRSRTRPAAGSTMPRSLLSCSGTNTPSHGISDTWSWPVVQGDKYLANSSSHRYSTHLPHRPVCTDSHSGFLGVHKAHSSFWPPAYTNIPTGRLYTLSSPRSSSGAQTPPGPGPARPPKFFPRDLSGPDYILREPLCPPRLPAWLLPLIGRRLQRALPSASTHSSWQSRCAAAGGGAGRGAVGAIVMETRSRRRWRLDGADWTLRRRGARSAEWGASWTRPGAGERSCGASGERAGPGGRFYNQWWIF
ncbi:uncharacterized protein LOC141494886 [Macrotis lagotis]|uniref:uncharacterized protein LOC141494886 n=1 Tax=Macrotis lagotis TaxID=92651 RepID=UPI003D68BB35